MDISAHIVKKRGKYDRDKLVEQTYTSWADWCLSDFVMMYAIEEHPFELACKPESLGYVDGLGRQRWKITFLERRMIKWRKKKWKRDTI